MLLAISFVSGIQSTNVSDVRMFAQTSSQLNLTPELSQKFKNVASHTELAENLAQLAGIGEAPTALNPATPKPQQKAPTPKPKTLKEAIADGTASAAFKKKQKPTHLKKKGLAETGKLGVKANKNGSKVIKKKPALTHSKQKVNLFAPKVTKKKGAMTPAQKEKRRTDWIDSHARRGRRADMTPEQRKKEMKFNHGLHALTHHSRKNNKREAHHKKMHEEMKKH